MKAEDTIKNNLLTYANVLEDRMNFRRSGGPHSDSFNVFDTPGVKYFKIFFYFNNGDSDSVDGAVEKSTGLLAPTWELENIVNNENYYQYNTAWSYLKMNYEDERAEQLKQFVNLLSNISTKSPWYFSEISGLDAALERKQTMDQTFKFEEERKKISIKCLPDAQDNRIGTLLDLYRSIVWSWRMKRMILPANLRKFDMGIFIFSDPVENINVSKYNSNDLETTIPGRLYNKNVNLLDTNAMRQSKSIESSHSINHTVSQIGGNNQELYKTSYKYVEFHNCEIDYNAGKTAWGTLSNVEGMSPSYTIDILFDDCYEHNYNEFNMREFGDMIMWDLISKDYEYKNDENTYDYLSFGNQYDKFHGVKYEWLPAKITAISNTIVEDIIKETDIKNETQNKLVNLVVPRRNMFGQGPLLNALGQVVNVVKDAATGILKKAVLGNLYTFSLSRMYDQAKDLLQGDVWSVARGVAEYVQDAKQRDEHNLPSHHSMFEQTEITKKYLGESQHNLFEPKKITPRIKRIGNLAKSQTIANNL